MQTADDYCLDTSGRFPTFRLFSTLCAACGHELRGLPRPHSCPVCSTSRRARGIERIVTSVIAPALPHPSIALEFGGLDGEPRMLRRMLPDTEFQDVRPEPGTEVLAGRAIFSAKGMEETADHEIDLLLVITAPSEPATLAAAYRAARRALRPTGILAVRLMTRQIRSLHLPANAIHDPPFEDLVESHLSFVRGCGYDARVYRIYDAETGLVDYWFISLPAVSASGAKACVVEKPPESEYGWTGARLILDANKVGELGELQAFMASASPSSVDSRWLVVGGDTSSTAARRTTFLKDRQAFASGLPEDVTHVLFDVRNDGAAVWLSALGSFLQAVSSCDAYFFFRDDVLVAGRDPPFLISENSTGRLRVGRLWLERILAQHGYEASWREVRAEEDAVRPVLCAFPLEFSKEEQSNFNQVLVDRASGLDYRIELSAMTGPRNRIRPTLEFVRPVANAGGLKSICVRLSVPPLTIPSRLPSFGTHILDSSTGEATDKVVLLDVGAFLLSADLGHTFERFELKGLEKVRFQNLLVKEDGNLLLQAVGDETTREKHTNADDAARIFNVRPNGSVIGSAKPSDTHWHGPRSIAERGGTIMFADYHDNNVKRDRRSAVNGDGPGALKDGNIFRSRNGGLSWQPVLTISHRDIRHFHTLVVDPFEARTWWASSGDGASQCRVWRSVDDGDSWREVSHSDVAFVGHPSFRGSEQSCFRFTDIVVGSQALLWGADDPLAGVSADHDPYVPRVNQVGSRIFHAEKSDRLNPVAIGLCGQHVRNFIDVGPGYLILTEAKMREFTLDPQVFFLPKTYDPTNPESVQYLFSVPNLRGIPTGFTHSRSSTRARNGVFFSGGSAGCPFPGSTRFLRWEVTFS